MENSACGVPPPHFIVFVPGYMGSRLRSRSTGELVWLDLPDLLREPQELPNRLGSLFASMQYPNDDLVPDGVVDQLLFLPPLFKQEQYGRLFQVLKGWGYSIADQGVQMDQPVVYTFAYDWRQDNRLSARALAQAVQTWKIRHPDAQVWVIAHSNGGIVARWYIEKEGGRQHVNRLFLLASPWDGAPKSLQVLQAGLDIFLLRFFNRLGVQQIIRETALTFPSFYQLLPSYLPFLKNGLGQVFELFKDKRWLESDGQRSLLADALKFNRELGTDLSVETLCFFGIKQPTTSRGVIRLSVEGRFEEICWEVGEDGDGTVPVHSARHMAAVQHLPYNASHGDLYVYPPLLEKLKYELIDRYRYGALASVRSSRLIVHLQAERDVYAPGEIIRFTATLNQLDGGLPVYDAQIEARLVYQAALVPRKFDPVVQQSASNAHVVRLEESRECPGMYYGCLTAPDIPAYYVLAGSFMTRLEPPIQTSDLILVEPDS